jgi:ATP-dependent Lhr-like helicase
MEVLAQLEGLPLPWSELHTTLLPARVAGFHLDMLDVLAASGQIVWVGNGPLGTRDGRLVIYRRDHAGRLLEPPAGLEESTALHDALLTQLDGRGASFLFELEQGVREALGEVASDELEAALWDLVWAGVITNDTFAPLRALGASRSRNPRRRGQPSLAGGRWSRVSQLVDTRPTDTERSLARAEMILERYGIVSREAAITEELSSGFGPLYRVLTAMEDAGRIRRGYFIEGLSGAQFARPGVIDRLRASRAPIDEDPQSLDDAAVLVLPATDPANIFGALLPWPATGGGEAQRPRRVAGAWVILVRGRAVLYLGPGGRQLLTFPGSLHDERELDLALKALHRLPRGVRRRSPVIEKIDGVNARESVHFERMRRCGFESEYRGLAPRLSAVS